MKTFILITLLSTLTALCAAQPARLVIETEYSGAAFHYWPLDGKQLPFTPFGDSEWGPVAVIELQSVPAVYELSVGILSFQVYATPGSADTVRIKDNSLSFAGTNRIYNEYLRRTDRSDRFCFWTDYEEHETAGIEIRKDLDRIVEKHKSEDLRLLANDSFSPQFVEQQRLMAELRYSLLFLNKLAELRRSGEPVPEDWLAALKKLELPLDDPAAILYPFFLDLFREYVHARNASEGVDPEALSGEARLRLLFDAVPDLIPDGNREYVLAQLIYDRLYWMDYTQTLASFHADFAAEFPDSPYLPAMAPGVEKMEEELAFLYDPEILFLEYDAEPRTFAEMVRPLRGKVVYIDYWDTRDNYVTRSFFLPRLTRKIYEWEDAVFLHVCLNEEARDKWEYIVRHLGMKGHHCLAPPEVARQILDSDDDTGGFSYPRSQILDKEGRAVIRYAANPDEPAEVLEQLRSVLERD